MLNITMINSPCSIDPGGTLTMTSSIHTIVVIVYYVEEHINYHYLYLTRLNCFTLSHYGSNSCLSTLKPNLTASAPRLATSDLPNLTRLGFHQLYIKHRTGAPSHVLYQKKIIFQLSLLSQI